MIVWHAHAAWGRALKCIASAHQWVPASGFHGCLECPTLLHCSGSMLSMCMLEADGATCNQELCI